MGTAKNIILDCERHENKMQDVCIGKKLLDLVKDMSNWLSQLTVKGHTISFA